MKAYCLSVKDEDDAGQAIVFAETVRDAKKQVFGHDTLVDALEGGWTALRAHRAKEYDGMENLTDAQLANRQWRNGWIWFDEYDMPDSDEATDEMFYDWYEKKYAGN